MFENLGLVNMRGRLLAASGLAAPTHGNSKMATLHEGDFSLEIRHREFEHGWVYYDIWPKWGGEPILNDAILKRHNTPWAKRGVGAIKACEYRECEVLPLLRRVLETNQPDYWTATDPDITLALYPDRGFPFLPPKSRVVYEAPHIIAEREARDRKRLETGPLPDDLIEMMLFVDVYNFSGAGAYHGSGTCFRFTPLRLELQKFYDDLRAEYVLFREAWNVQALNEEEYGEDYLPKEF